MKFTVITPVLNGDQYIEETISSVVNQQGDFTIEYLIFDGGSTDNTLDIVNKYRSIVINDSHKYHHVEIKVIQKNDKGMYDALANAFTMSSGDVVSYINSDDFYFPDAFCKIQRVFQTRSDVKWLTGTHVKFNAYGEIIWQKTPNDYNSRMIRVGMYGRFLPFIQQEPIFFRSELIHNIDINEFRNYRLAGDYYLWKTFSSNTRLYVFDDLIAGFRVRENQLSKQIDLYFNEFNKIRKNANPLDYALLAFVYSKKKFPKLFRNKYRIK